MAKYKPSLNPARQGCAIIVYFSNIYVYVYKSHNKSVHLFLKLEAEVLNIIIVSLNNASFFKNFKMLSVCENGSDVYQFLKI